VGASSKVSTSKRPAVGGHQSDGPGAAGQQSLGELVGLEIELLGNLH
jgi:hypothetical protein